MTRRTFRNPLNLARMNFLKGIIILYLVNGSAYSVIAGVNICGPDVLVVEAHNVLVTAFMTANLNTSRTWLVFDIRSPDSPRLVQQFDGGSLISSNSDWLQKSEILWHDSLNVGYSESLADPFGTGIFPSR